MLSDTKRLISSSIMCSHLLISDCNPGADIDFTQNTLRIIVIDIHLGIFHFKLVRGQGYGKIWIGLGSHQGIFFEFQELNFQADAKS